MNGFSTLLSWTLMQNPSVSIVIGCADLRYETGELFETSGFKKLKVNTVIRK